MRIYTYLVFAICIFVSCDSKEEKIEAKETITEVVEITSIVVKGKFVGTPLPDTITVLKSMGKKMLPLNGAKVEKDGSFELPIKDNELWVYFIEFGKQRIPFVGDEQVIELSINLDEVVPDVIYHNSREGKLLKAMAPFVNLDSLEKGKGFALANAPSFVSMVFAQSYLNPKEEYEFLTLLAQKYSITKHGYASRFVKEVTKNNPNFLKVGSKIPNIALPNQMGEIVELESLRGKVVLLDFWASWCGPCLNEMPNVKKAYDKYHTKGFDVYGVSLDQKRQKWVGTIERLGMPWVHVSDLKMWNSPVVSEFGIQGIPFTILVGKDGTILAKNLRGSYLDKKLAELF